VHFAPTIEASIIAVKLGVVLAMPAHLLDLKHRVRCISSLSYRIGYRIRENYRSLATVKD
jgi:hypothetical protein